MSLNVFQTDLERQDDYARNHMAQQLPATLGEGFDAAWKDSLYFGQSVHMQNARQAAFREFADETFRRSNGQVNLIDPTIGVSFGTLDDYNREVVKHAAQHPDLGLKVLSDDDLDNMAIEYGKKRRQEFQEFAQREKTTGATFGMLLGAGAGAFTDPVNLIAFPLAAPQSLGVLGTTAAWAGIGGGTQLVIEGLGAGTRERIQPGYQASGEMGHNIAGAALFAGALGGGLKGVANVWTRYKTGEWPRHVRDAGNVVEGEAQIADTNRFPGVEGEAAHRSAMQKAIDDTVAGRPVDVSGELSPSVLAAYDAKLAPVLEARARAVGATEEATRIERQSVVNPEGATTRSAEVTGWRDVARAVDEEAGQVRTRIGEAQTALEVRAGEIEGLRTEAQRLRDEVAATEQRVKEARPPIDDVTQARLDTIDADLKSASKDTRALLEAEREQITSTLTQTAPGDARLIGSLRQEAKGLQAALRRAEAAVGRAEKSVARAGEKGIAAPARVATQEARIASRQATAASQTARSIQRLASDGYGVRLPRSDADAFADLLLRAGDDVEAAMRQIGEELTDRAVAARRARPPERTFGESDPVQVKRDAAAYHVDETRKAVQAVAREVGHEMPPADAAKIAQSILGRSEDEALAILDELMLRPRTLAETLPGTEAARGGAAKLGKSQQSVESPTLSAAYRAMDPVLSPAEMRKARGAPETAEMVDGALSHLLAERPDLQYPVSVTRDAAGKEVSVMRSVRDALDETDRRLAAAKEIEACARPHQEAA